MSTTAQLRSEAARLRAFLATRNMLIGHALSLQAICRARFNRSWEEARQAQEASPSVPVSAVSAYPLHTTTFVAMSDLFKGFAALQTAFTTYDRHGFSWGGNNRSLVDFASFCRALEEATELQADDTEGSALASFLKLHEHTDPNLYVDLEN